MSSAYKKANNTEERQEKRATIKKAGKIRNGLIKNTGIKSEFYSFARDRQPLNLLEWAR